MVGQWTVVTRWMDRECGKTDKQNLRGTSIMARDGVIYSYGTHFPMAEVLRDRKGRIRLILLNGDRWGVATTGHQSHVLSAVQRSGHPFVTIPFDALDAAGIDRRTIELLDRTDDTWTETKHESAVPPSSWLRIPKWQRNEREKYHFAWYNRGGRRRDAGYVREVNGERVFGYHRDATWESWWEDHPDAWHVPNADYVTLGDGTVVNREHPLDHKPDLTKLKVTYHWTTRRHWLGESFIRAKVRGRGTRWVYFISGFDHNERRPLYHLSELPGPAVNLKDAYESLKPDTVKVAETMGREVKRQGDIFAVPTELEKRTLSKRGATYERRGRLLGTSHVATEVARMPDGTALARGTLTHDPEAWRRPDHARVKMGDGKTWHIIIKNTVPVVG